MGSPHAHRAAAVAVDGPDADEAAVELTKIASDPRWAREPFGMVQALGARLVDLEDTLRKAGRIEMPKEGLRLVR